MHKTIGAIITLLICLLIVQSDAVQTENNETPESRNVRVALQQKVAELPMVEVNTKIEEVGFETIDLTETLTDVEGKRYFAFRFTTPQNPGDLIWSFRAPKGHVGWYIVPAEGRMNGFRTFYRHTLSQDVPTVGEQGDIVVMQELPTRDLKPNTDYIIWFRLADDVAPIVPLSLNVLPDHSHSRYLVIFPMLFDR